MTVNLRSIYFKVSLNNLTKTLLESFSKDELHQLLFKVKIIKSFLNISTVDELKSILDYTDIKKIRGYSEFNIKNKNSKKDRKIYAPNKKLKILQQKLNNFLSKIYSPPKSVHAYIYKKNIKSNASLHLKNNIIYTTDIKDFFPSIHYGRVRNLFKSNPFNFNIEIANEIASIVIYNNMLPQGAPTSPIISNMISLKLDIALLQIAKKYHVTYTRYADDITFSCNRKTLMDNIIPLIKDAININGFKINIDKTRLSYKYDSQKVTGLKVNEFLNVDRKYIRQLNSQLYAWDKYGYDNAQKDFLLKYYGKHRAKKKPEFLNVLYGRLTFLKYIKGEDNSLFIKLAKKFNTLFLRDHALFEKINNINKLTYNDLSNFNEKLFVIEYIHSNSDESSGTGFILHGYPFLITCSHVVGKVKGNSFIHDGCVTVINHKNQKERIKLIKKHDHYDIAILELPSFLKNKYILYNASLSISQLKSIPESTNIEYFGFPNYNVGDRYSKTEALVTTTKISSLRTYIEVDKTIKAGNSGGPALIQKQVVGLCTHGDHTLSNMPNKIIFISHILEVLNSIK